MARYFQHQEQYAATEGNITFAPSPYRHVRVLTLQFQRHDLRSIDDDITQFRGLCHKFNFTVEHFNIPQNDAERETARRIQTFMNDYGLDSNDLVIIYYAGHGFLDDERRFTLWASNKPADRAEVHWEAFRSSVIEAPSDALVVFDCCTSGGATLDGWQPAAAGQARAAKEIIAASAFETDTYDLFTPNLCDELREMRNSGGVIMTSDLCHRLTTRLKGAGRYARNPVHHKLSVSDRHGGGICLSPKPGSGSNVEPVNRQDYTRQGTYNPTATDYQAFD